MQHQTTGTPPTVGPDDRGRGSETIGRSKPKSALANAGWNVFLTLWTSAMSLVLTPWLVRALGLEHYGMLLLIWSLTGMLGILNMGLGEATLRYIALHYARADMQGINRVLGSTLAMYLGVSAILSLTLLFAAPAIVESLGVSSDDAPLVVSLVRLTAVVVTLGILTRTVGAVPAALQRYDVTTKISMANSLLRFGGYMLLLAFGFGVFQLVLWDALMMLAMLVTQAVIARRLLPGIIIWPRWSVASARELLGYSVWSFLTYVFHMTHRESAKLMTGAYLGTAGVSYIGAPDGLSQRVHGLVASAGETLLPRFTATEAEKTAMLFWNANWIVTFVTVAVFVPYAVLLPDFLRLWIDGDFAARAAFAGQLVALSYVTQSIFVPAATFARGSGRPGVVTGIILACGLTMLGSGAVLIPRMGLTGVGLAYALASVPAAAGTWYVARTFFFDTPSTAVVRSFMIPIAIGVAACSVCVLIRRWTGPLGWIGLLLFGGLAGVGTAIVMLLAEEIAGRSDSRARIVVAQVARRLGVRRLVVVPDPR